MKAAAHAGFSPAHVTPTAAPRTLRPLIALAFEGLSEDEKELAPMLAYDAHGSGLYEKLCEQPEYYLARSESRLLERHGAEIADVIGAQAAIVGYGMGAPNLTPLLLDALLEPYSFVGIDVDAQQLERRCAALRDRFDSVRVDSICQDFRDFVVLPGNADRASRLVAYFAGSTVGGFRALEAVALLSSIRETMGPAGGLLVGVDLLKNPDIHERAYNDAAGVTAALNLNMLGRLNREVDATFSVEGFRHSAQWNGDEKRIEMRLVSVTNQSPTIAGIGVNLAAGETIRTGYAHKYTVDEFAMLARVAGWNVRQVWIEPQNQYSLQYLESVDAEDGF